jgi:hypothetical protein
MKYVPASKFQQKFRHEFHDERVPSRQTIHNLVDKFRSTGLLIDKKQKHACLVLTEGKLDDMGFKPRKSVKHLAQENGMSKSSERRATQLLKLRPYETTVIHALQLRNRASRIRFCSWFL